VYQAPIEVYSVLGKARSVLGYRWRRGRMGEYRLKNRPKSTEIKKTTWKNIGEGEP